MGLLVLWRSLSFERKDDRLSWLIYGSRFFLLGVFVKESGIIRWRSDQGVRLDEGIHFSPVCQGLCFQFLHDLPHNLARLNMAFDCHGAGLLDERGCMTAGQRKDAAHLPLAKTPLFLE